MKFEEFKRAAIAALVDCPKKASEIAQATGANGASVYNWLKKLVIAGDIVKGHDGVYRLATNEELSEAFIETAIAESEAKPVEVEVIEEYRPRASMTVPKPNVEDFTTTKVDGRVTVVKKSSLEATETPLSESKPLASLQLSLMDVAGKTKSESAQIQWLPVERLTPHPDNPRLIYRDDIIDTIAQSIIEGGFKPEYALLVRPFDGNYQIISGHTRHKAAIAAGCKMLPCWVKELDDESAFFELKLANNQGELSFLEEGKHTLAALEKYELPLKTYIKKIGGKETDRIKATQRMKAFEIFGECKMSYTHAKEKGSHLYALTQAPKQYWQQLTELLIEKEWSVKQTETIVNAIKEVDIPEVLHSFLVPEVWVKKVIADATSDNPQGLQTKVMLWVNSAVDDLDSLATDEGVWQFDDDGNPFRSVVNLQAKLLEKLPGLVNGDQVPSKKKINALTQSITEWVKACNDKYAQWEKAQASKEEAERQQKEKDNQLKAMKVEYAPTGINDDLRNLTLADLGNKEFDAIITDPPYLLSNDGFTLRSGKEASVNKNFEDTEGVAIAPEEWVPLVSQWLKPGGVLVATCTLHIYHRLEVAAKAEGLETEREQAIWLKPNSPPQLSPTLLQPDFEYIFLAFKPGDHSFGAEEYRERYGCYPSRTFSIPQCGGSERLGWHDTQKPLELFEKLITLYVPKDGRVLDPFSGSGTTSVAAKRLGRIAYWVEKDPGHYANGDHRIETAPFFWEVANG